MRGFVGFLLVVMAVGLGAVAYQSFVVLPEEGAAPTGPATAAPTADGAGDLAAEVQRLQSDCTRLQEELDAVLEENGRLRERLEVVEFSVDEVTNLAVKSALGREFGGERGPAGATASGRADTAGGTASAGGPGDAQMTALVGSEATAAGSNPVFVASVRAALDRIQEEERIQREQREEQREIDRLAQLSERFGLTPDQQAAVTTAIQTRREASRAVRDQVRAGELTWELARPMARDAQEQYRAVLQAVLTPEQFQGMERSLSATNRFGGGRDRGSRQPSRRGSQDSSGGTQGSGGQRGNR